MKSLRMLGFATVILCAAFVNAQSPWTPVNNVPNIGAGAELLLTDGRVLVHDESGNSGTWGNWWTLTPDINGNYATGTWSQVATLPSGYGPLYFASAVLPDGRVAVEGGEYNNGNGVWTKLGAVYDPTVSPPMGQWTAVSPPSGWSNIGDAQSVILSTGIFMLADCCSKQEALADKAYTPVWTSTGANKFDENDEEGWNLLPGGNVLTVDAYVGSYQSNGTNSEIYNPGTGSWTSAGSTIVQLWDSAANCGGSGHASYEVGPAVLMPNGTVFATGANSCGAGHTAIYNVSAGTWTAGPDFPGNFDIADGPAALETNGKVLMMASPGIYQSGAEFFEWNGTNLTQVQGPPNGSSDSSYYGHMLMLPTGQIMFTDFSNDVELYNSTGSNYPGWAPSALLLTVALHRGNTITLFGSQFNGVSQDGAYGDDFQDATNYPLVRFTNNSTGHVFYGRTHGHNTMAVGYRGPSYTQLDIPSNMETGASTLQVVVNGIPSPAYPIVIE